MNEVFELTEEETKLMKNAVAKGAHPAHGPLIPITAAQAKDVKPLTPEERIAYARALEKKRVARRARKAKRKRKGRKGR